MANGDLNWIANFIWGIADDVLRDLYVRGKYRDVILPMMVLRRLDAVLELTKRAVLDMRSSLDESGIVHQDQALRQAAGQAFYNTSKFTLRDLKARASQQQLKADFEAYLDGFSPNVQDILEKFEFRNQIPRLSKADALGTLIEKFLSPNINLSPNPVLNADGSEKHPGLDNHAMGTIFEELVRRFNEENNEEAGEHWTPRDVVKLMARLVFMPIADQVESGTYLLYDGACGTGGMLTVAEETLQQLAQEHGKQAATHLYGQEINAETYAICKADLLLKGEGDAADNIIGGPEYSTLSNDAFPSREFDFMLSNPPYGKSWKSDLEHMGGKDAIKDPRFVIEHAGDPEYSLITRSSDGQMMFLANMLSKMKHSTKLGSRIAEVHNGSSLFTGDASQGESNIRRWIIENDWLEAIIGLPQNMFYNTPMETYIWVLSNRKPEHRRGKIQLIDATLWFKPLRKNLGKKNSELCEDDIARICETFLEFKGTKQSKIFPNTAFGYWKIAIERPLRFKDIDPTHVYSAKEIKNLKKILERAKDGQPVISKIHKRGTTPDPPRGRYEVAIDGMTRVVEYEPDRTLRDYERVPLNYANGIDGFFEREILPRSADAWIAPESASIGYRIPFQKIFFRPPRVEEIHSLVEATNSLFDQADRGRGSRHALMRGIEELAQNTALPKVVSATEKNTADFGRRWIGEIPSSWQLKRARHVFTVISDKGHENEQLLSVTQDRGVLPRSELDINVVMPAGSTKSYKLVKPGDFIISLRSFQGGIEFSDVRGLVSPAYVVLRPVIPIDENFFRYLMKTPRFVAELASSVSGVRQGKNITFDDFGEILLPIPPLEEQRLIAQRIVELDALALLHRRLSNSIHQEVRVAANELIVGWLTSTIDHKLELIRRQDRGS